MLEIGLKLGWAPGEFWRASMWELTTAIAIRLEAAAPPQGLTDDEIWDLFSAIGNKAGKNTNA